jgi:hypothetical protein
MQCPKLYQAYTPHPLHHSPACLPPSPPHHAPPSLPISPTSPPCL